MSKNGNVYQTEVSREKALELLHKYNKDEFQLRHAEIVEKVMRYFANKLGYAEEADFWGLVGLLHDVDFGSFPDQHCIKAPELLEEIGAEDSLVRAVVSHGYGLCTDVEPIHEMEKVLYATDELTGLIGAVALMRPSKSVDDLEVKSVRKKYKNPKFAAGCSRDVIEKGANMLGWEVDYLISETILAMR